MGIYELTEVLLRQPVCALLCAEQREARIRKNSGLVAALIGNVFWRLILWSIKMSEVVAVPEFLVTNDRN